MVRASLPSMSLDEFLKLPETKPASEFIEGKAIRKPMPQGKHSSIQAELSSTINSTLRTQKIARAFPELRCTFGGRSIVPDIVVLSWDNIPREETGSVANIVSSAPDWVVEILSPDQNQNRLTEKILHCLRCGTALGWIIDPEEVTVLSYQTGELPQFYDRPEAVLPVPSFAAGLEITVGDLAGFLLD